jgi:hypothetical protein
VAAHGIADDERTSDDRSRRYEDQDGPGKRPAENLRNAATASERGRICARNARFKLTEAFV